MESEEMLAALRRRLEPAGLNLFGIAAVRAYDERVPARLRLGGRWPAARSVLVVGSGGAAFWHAASVAQRQTAAPLDRFAESTFAAASRDLLRPLDPVPLYPHRFGQEPVSFMQLAECAGLGARSLLGILIRPDYGTWFALRAAALLSADLPPSPPLAFDPCPACAKPCVEACPGGAVSERGWNIPSCVAFRCERDRCGDGCHSRVACPYGGEHRYPVEEQRHHQAYALASMRALAGSQGLH